MFRRTLKVFLEREAARFIIVGGVNSAISYGIGVGAYLLLAPMFHIVVIGLVTSASSFVVSYLNQRLWVFRSTHPWWPQLRRSFVVYGALSVLGTLLLWALLEVAGLSIWISQAVVIVACSTLSYAGQRWFTFRNVGSV